MPIIATPDSATELTQLRTLRGKVFALPNGKRRLITKLGRVHYRDDDTTLKDIELTTEVEAGTGEIVANKLPYRFRLRTTGIGFDYQSREDGLIIRKALTRVGNTNIDQNATFAYTINGNRIRYANVGTDLDVIFQIGRTGIQTFWICKSASAPKTVRWANEYDLAARGKIADTIRGLDNLNNEPREGRNRRPLNVSFSDGNATQQPSGRWRFIRTETWTGETEFIDPVTHVKSWVNNAIYPAAVDPDITEEIPANNNDGLQYGSSWFQNYSQFGDNYSSSNRNWGCHFTSVAVDQGVTIDLANLVVNVTGSAGGGYASGTIYGSDVDNASTAWSNSYLPSGRTQTSASTAFARPTGTGIHTKNVTAIIQEIVDRAGWASGNDIKLFIINTDTSNRRTILEDYNDAGTAEAQLEIDFTAGGGGGTAANLLIHSQAIVRASRW